MKKIYLVSTKLGFVREWTINKCSPKNKILVFEAIYADIVRLKKIGGLKIIFDQ